ncbi:MAG TPA: BatA domain-containing protein [Cyclobacteriaceae bacterium]|nr:BatA domain-containing protein [Cyclobacteriaceae bacterium]
MFAQPLYLFALAGLAIPITIHLLSRKDGKIIKLGSVRHVQETSTPQFKGIKLNEILLLFLRCAMITVFSFLLSGLQCRQSSSRKWVLIEKDLERFQTLNRLMDSLNKEGYDLRWLAEGFPGLIDSSRVNRGINYWRLTEQLKQFNLSEVIVFSKNDVSHFNGLRISLPPNVRWISQPTAPIDFSVRAISTSRDSALLITGHTGSDQTNFTSKTITANASPVAISAPDRVELLMIADNDFDYDKKIIKAALQAIEKALPLRIEMKWSESDPAKTLPHQAAWCFWLSSSKPVGVNARKIVRIDPQVSDDLIIQTAPYHWAITKRLTEDAALLHHLPLQLAALFLQERTAMEREHLPDHRMIPDSLAWRGVSHQGEIKASVYNEPADRFLVALLLLLVLAERILSYKRNQ